MELKDLVKEAYYYDKSGMLLFGDCLDWMPKIPDGSIDMILADLPYGTTSCKWDAIIPFDELWGQYERIIKDNGAIVLTSSQPFTSALVMSNPKLFKYEWVWDKKQGGNAMLVKKQPYKVHENILVFSKSNCVYFPKMTKGKMRRKGMNYMHDAGIYGGKRKSYEKTNDDYYPKSILEISNAKRTGRLHPTQKPVELFKYLIETYSKENEIVLDNVAGSCTTAVAAKNTNRKWICIEKEEKYCEISKKRVQEYIQDVS